ncbi:hypothetical protein BZJ19_10125 [Salinivibrio proteolyticus]|nr:hypothetical protein BZJ19_10125 [Salinivibrio proteolyticus]
MSAVWDAPAFSGNTKLIMLCLADYANDDGLCWPSIDAVARKCSVSKSTVKAQIKRLIERGYVSAKRRKRTTEEGRKTNDTNLYQLNVNAINDPELTEGENCPRSESALGRNSAGGGSNFDPKPSLDPSVKRDPPIVPQNQSADNTPSKAKTDKRKTLKTTLPENFSVTESMREWYAQQNFSLCIEEATAQWCDAMLAKQTKYVDWPAAWRNGMRNANKWAAQRSGGAPARNINQVPDRSSDFSAPAKYRKGGDV